MGVLTPSSNTALVVTLNPAPVMATVTMVLFTSWLGLNPVTPLTIGTVTVKALVNLNSTPSIITARSYKPAVALVRSKDAVIVVSEKDKMVLEIILVPLSRSAVVAAVIVL